MDEKPTADIVFTQSVKAAQQQRGSRALFARRESGGAFPSRVTPELTAFLAEIDTAFFATASAAGQPYLQHRGGPKGFIQALDPHTLGFADFAGNRQYVTLGNLSENDRAFLFLMDYARARRVKIWGTARIVEDDPDLLARLMPAGYRARGERAILLRVAAWDINCPQHIPPKLDAEQVAALVAPLEERIAGLERDNRRLADALLAGKA